MPSRFVTIWFRYLKTDWFTIRNPHLREVPFVLALPDHGRMIITEANLLAEDEGIEKGMVLADARALIPSLHFFDDQLKLAPTLLKKIAEWCIRFTPIAAVDLPDCILLDVTGCTHLWSGDKNYLDVLTMRLKVAGYNTKAALADTIGAAWAFAHFGSQHAVIRPGDHITTLFPLPPDALRLQLETLERLKKLGLTQVKTFAGMPRSTLRRRFGDELLQRLDQAWGYEEETIYPVQPIQPYQERLPCLEPIVTATGIGIALERLLEQLCLRLQKEQKGVRMVVFKAFRVDGKVEKIQIGTNHPSHNAGHLFKLFELKISSIEPALGIELFVLDASKVDEVSPFQEKFWESAGSLENIQLSELIDRLANKIGPDKIRRYLPDEHHWPERSVKLASFLQEKVNTGWRSDKLRPIHILSNPEPILVTAPIPDYPPMLFRYKNKLHTIKKADGPERIEREWWLEEGPHRDYYCVEDENGNRYWLFRSGHYGHGNDRQWFIHGFFP